MASVRGRNRTQLGAFFGPFLVAGGASGTPTFVPTDTSQLLADIAADVPAFFALEAAELVDVAPFFEVDMGFGEQVSWTEGGPLTLSVIWTDDSVDGGDRGGPFFLVATTDIATLLPGHTIVRGSTSYTVAGRRPDGVGITRVVLDEV